MVRFVGLWLGEAGCGMAGEAWLGLARLDWAWHGRQFQNRSN
jgi:hypothetical protein